MSAAVGHTPAQLRRTRHTLPPLDTPTPASSSTSANNTASLITSIKPTSRSKHSIHLSTLPRAPPLSHSHLINSLNTRELHFDDDDDEGDDAIPIDASERARRRDEQLEHDMRAHLNNLQPSSASSSGDSLGFGGLSDAEGGDFRARMEDESIDEEEDGRRGGGGQSSSEQSFGDDFSLRVGMTGTRAAPAPAPHHQQSSRSIHPVDVDQSLSEQEEEDDSLEYLTISRTSLGSARRPPPPAVSAPAQKVPSPSPLARGPTSLGKEFHRVVNLGAAPTAARKVFHDLNGGSRPSPQQQQQHQVPSPRHAPRLAPFPRTSPSPVVEAKSALSSAPNVHYYGEEVTGQVLPDTTGVTFGLRSPAQQRGRQEEEEEEDLDDLRARLARLERSNALSRAKVRELEEDLKAAQSQQQEQGEHEELEERLSGEMERRAALEATVTRLRAQVTHLTHSLESHAASLSALRQQPPPPTSSPNADAAVREEVTALRHGLEELHEEVEHVKGVVEELLREKVRGMEWEREEGERRDVMRGEREGEPRVEGMARRDRAAGGEQARQGQEEDPDRTPRAREKSWKQHQQQAQGQQQQWSGPETPKLGRSFIDDVELQRLQADLAREEARRSPLPAPRRRPSTAPLPAAVPHQHRRPTRSYASYDDSSSSATPHPAPRARAEDELAQDFRRAEAIFRSVSVSGGSVSGDGKGATPGLCTVCRRRRGRGRREARGHGSAPAKLGGEWEVQEEQRREKERERARRRQQQREQEQQQAAPRVDPRLALENVLRDLEADFETHKKIYIELSDRYRAMDAKLGGGKRKALAEHLKESIDTLEIKADQVKRLHDLLHYHEPAAPAEVGAGRPSFGPGRQRECVV